MPTTHPRLVLIFLLLVPAHLRAEDVSTETARALDSEKRQDLSVEQIAKDVRDSVVKINHSGRTGEQSGLGAGFVISEDGIIATNLHVIGEGQPISLEFANGKKYDVTSIHAFDRALDLALVKIDAMGLPRLELGNSEAINQGRRVVGFGHPLGLEHSVVDGLVSGKRNIDGREMLQLAMPIEPGNSGGPVLDRQGRVVGVVTMKSAVTRNLGFAAPIHQLRSLIDRPNPIPIAQWLRIGEPDPELWTPLFGARWGQRPDRITVSEPGKGFGGRSLCLSTRDLPEIPFEMGVSVRLGDESGAAGLVFHVDDQHRHYGFYPSVGQMRLSRFDGPIVYSWQVLHEINSPHYRPGKWNHLKVRIEKDKLLCYVNDQLVVESKDTVYSSGRLGLVKFRDTSAEFRQFAVAARIPQSQVSDDVKRQIVKQLDELPSLSELRSSQFSPLAPHASTGTELLRQRAKNLESQAEELRQIAHDLHVQSVIAGLTKEMAQEDVDLCRAALQLAKLDDEELDIGSYITEIDRMADRLRALIPAESTDADKLQVLNQYMFKDNGYHGNRTDYYHRVNSYLNRVIDDRQGLPITLSVLYMELGRRIGLYIDGVGLPGHFVVRHVPREGEPQLVDVFDGGTLMTRADAEKRVRDQTGTELREAHLQAASKQSIIRRMLRNLMGVAYESDDQEAILRYLDAILALTPDGAQERHMRAFLRARTGRHASALTDLDWLIEKQPPAVNLEEVRRLREFVVEQQK